MARQRWRSGSHARQGWASRSASAWANPKLALLEQAAEDYCTSLAHVYRYGDYFAVNVSSPNTPGLRGLQEKGQLDELLGALRRKQGELAGATPRKPLFVKVAPRPERRGARRYITGLRGPSDRWPDRHQYDDRCGPICAAHRRKMAA